MFKFWGIEGFLILFMLCSVVKVSSFQQRILHSSAKLGWNRHRSSQRALHQRVLQILRYSPSEADSDNMETPTFEIPSNQELVAHRLAVAKAKRDARTRSIQKRKERNYKFKELLESSTDERPAMYAIKVSVCEELRKSMKLSGKEKRGRVFLEDNNEAVRSMAALKEELQSFFRSLKKGSYVLYAGFPSLAEDGSILSSNDDIDISKFWHMNADEDVVKTFAAADDFFANHEDTMKRPSIVIHVQKDPNAPEPPPPPKYLDGMASPADTEFMTMLSFYAFPPTGIENPESFAASLRKKWKPFAALGRVYVAKEGVNAQMSVPTNVIDNFVECCKSIPELQNMENGVNIDPLPLSMEEFAVAGVPADGGEASPPFRNLHVRVRNQIVADGLTKALDWQSAGYDMPPLEWHETLKRAQETSTDAKDMPVILDCRNTYETDVGIFQGAEPLGTENFRESWDALKERLENTPKDAPIMTYCTGGIRCVKVGSYLTQEMGFTNVSRLAGGIIAYDRTLQGKDDEKEESLFKGTNFVFDGRLGRPITEDAMAICTTCGSETSLVSNCRNGNCHKRMVQCENCRTSFLGTCSDACRNRLVHGTRSVSPLNSDVGSSIVTETTIGPGFASLEEYSTGHSTPPPSVYREIEFNTNALIPSGSHMVSGEAQGRLLKQLASMTRNGRVLELGTLTGYATTCLVEGASAVAQITAPGKLGSRQSGPFVMSMERDAKAFDVAVAHLRTVSKFGFGEEASEALCALRSRTNGDSVPSVAEKEVSLTFDDEGVTCDLIHVSDALASLEELAAGRGDLFPCAPFDLIFVDADKTRLYEYADACLSSDELLNRGGLIVVDNVLWKGLVLEASNNADFVSLSSDDENEEADEIRRNRRARKLANKMHMFNNAIAADDRAEVLVLPLRDGLSIIRKK